MYRSANLSMNRSIFCASPGSRKDWRYILTASVKVKEEKSSISTKACMIATLLSSLD